MPYISDIDVAIMPTPELLERMFLVCDDEHDPEFQRLAASIRTLRPGVIEYLKKLHPNFDHESPVGKTGRALGLTNKEMPGGGMRCRWD